jgi:serine/threonine protein kinase
MDTDIDNDDIKIIKIIGKGSFSNVFLCSKPLIDGKVSNQFIIKKIDTNELVKKYKMKNMSRKKIVPCHVSSKVQDKNDDESDKTDDIEYRYYYKKLEEMIEGEIDILKMLDDLNIIKFYEYTRKRGIYYLHMEYCNGGDVYEYLKKNKEIKRNSFGGFSDDFLISFIRQTSNGLKYIHDKNIIHRDIKLHNILIYLTDNNYIIFKISDFGFSCYDLTKGSFNAEHVSSAKYLTDAEHVSSAKYFKLSGTPYYMAPEIILNMRKMENITSYKKKKISDLYFYDKRIDIWSLGICIYESIFNLLPFSNINNIKELENFYRMNIIQEIMNKKVNKKSFLNKTIKELLLGMLQIDRKKRYLIEDVIKNISARSVLDEIQIEKEINYREIENKDKSKDKSKDESDKMKQHIIRNPLSIISEESILNKSFREDGFMESAIIVYNDFFDTVVKEDTFIDGNKGGLFKWIYKMMV